MAGFKIPDHVVETYGKKFGKLTVESFCRREISTGSKRYFVNCICECGNTTIARTDRLKVGQKTHCGCVKPEKKKGFHESNHKLFFAGEENYGKI